MKNIFIGNLETTVTGASVRSLFEPHGAIRSVKLMTERETGLSRGFAFVEMRDEEAERAIAALNGSVIEGRAIDVHEGRPKLRLGRPAARTPRPGR